MHIVAHVKLHVHTCASRILGLANKSHVVRMFSSLKLFYLLVSKFILFLWEFFVVVVVAVVKNLTFL